MTDLLYFGYDWSEESAENKQNQADYIAEIKVKFPDVILDDAYCGIKGFRQEVTMADDIADSYYSWVLGQGWFYCSFALQLMSMDPEQRSEFERLFKLAKAEYPENFKVEIEKQSIAKDE